MDPLHPTLKNLFRAALSILLSAFLTATLPAATFTVLNTNNDGSGSLRQAVLDANAAAGDDTIDFDPSLDGLTITLTTGEIALGSNIAIDASALASGLTISGNHASRILQIPAGGHAISLANLTLTQGSATDGGALYNDSATLIITRCALTDSVADDDGGGIYNFNGAVNLIESTVSGNSSPNIDGVGGGIYNIGASSFLTITDSTISGNTSGNLGGGIYHATNSTLEIINSTISGNVGSGAGGLIIASSSTATVIHSTITDNSTTSGAGGGIRVASGTLEIENSVVAGNFAGSTGDDIHKDVTGAAITPSGANLIGDNDTVTAEFPEDGLLIGGSSLPLVNAILAPLANHGGPTRTHALLPGSPAIDTAVPAAGTPATDQRGTARPLDGDGNTTAIHDLGAFESDPADPPFYFPAHTQAGVTTKPTFSWTFQPLADSYKMFFGAISGSLSFLGNVTSPTFTPLPILPDETYYWRIDAVTGAVTTTGTELSFTTRGPLLVDTSIDENNGIAVNGISLRDAVTAANARPGYDLINFNPSLDGLTITLTGGPLSIASDLDIDAASLTGGLTVSGDADFSGTPTAGDSRIFTTSRGTIAITDLRLSGGYANGGGNNDDGGAIRNTASLTLADTTLSGNTSFDDGGALYSFNATVTVLNSTVSNNHSPESGGSGGGIFNTGASSLLTIIDSTISHNTSEFLGGGIFNNSSAALTLTNSTVSGNASSGAGGILITNTSTVTLVHSTIAGNSTTSFSGGGIRVASGTLLIENSVVAGNSSPTTSPDLRKDSTGDEFIIPTGANLIGVHGTVETEFPYDGILVGNAATPIAPLLAPLANYGGPTPTLMPLPGSPAIDAAITTASTPATDQRGAPRPTGPAPDLGAIEQYFLAAPPITDTDNDLMDDNLEPLYGFVVGIMDGHLDADGDLSTNTDELGNHTDPHNPSNALRILSIVPAAGYMPGNPLFDITWTTFPGLTYHIECNQDLDFTIPDIQGPFLPAGFTETQSILLLPTRDFLRIRRD